MPRGGPMFESFVAFESYPTDAFEQQYGLRFQQTGSSIVSMRHMQTREAASYPLLLAVGPGEALCVRLSYDPELFSGDAAGRLVQHFEHVLTQLTADLERPLAAVTLLSAAERAQVVEEWNATAVEDGPAVCLHALVAAQAARTPEATAVIAGDAHVSYGALVAQGQAVAGALRARGVGPEVRVGVWLDRSVELVVALLGVWEAGGAYVPLEPEDPEARRTFVLTDAAVRVVITTRARAASWSGPAACAVLCLEGDATRLEAAAPAGLVRTVGPDQAAYVIYTSGSTGQPKGVLNTHRGVFNRLMWMEAAYGLTAVDRVLQKTPYSFDVSVWEFVWPLMRGAGLVMARPWGHRDPAYLGGIIAQEQVSTVHFVPSMLQAFVEAGGLAACGSVRQIFCSGEALGAAVRDACLAQWPGRCTTCMGRRKRRLM